MKSFDNDQQFPNVNWDFLHNEITPSYNDNFPEANNLRFRVDGENSMAALNDMQQNALTTFTNRYRETLNLFGADSLLMGLQTYLRERYAQNPAVVNGVALPVDPNGGLTVSALQAYYQHPVHGALRYLSTPNPLIHCNANHVANNAAVITDENKKTIAAFWYALNNDENFVLPNEMSKEDGINWFINMLSSINRQHNWDRTRRNNDTLQMENYDDLEGDRPSCTWGVKQNLVQFLTQALVDDPNMRPLTVDIMIQLFKDYFILDNPDQTAIFNRIDTLNLQSLRQLKDAVNNFIAVNLGDFGELDLDEKTLLKQFSWSTNQIKSFLDQCKENYGVVKFKTRLQPQLNWITRKYDNYGQLTLAMVRRGFATYYDAIINRIDTRIANEEALLAQPAKSVKQEKNDSVVKAKKDKTKKKVELKKNKPKKEPAEKIARPYPLARSSTYLYNCAMHSVIHNWLSLPEDEIRALAVQHPIYDVLFQELFNYYELPGEYNREAIFALNRQFNHPRDREILWGQVFRITLRNLLIEDNRFNDAFSISDLQFIPDDFVAVLTQKMGANLDVHNRARVVGALPLAHYNIQNPQWHLSLHHLGNHYDFSFNDDDLNARHNAAHADKRSAKLYRASVIGGHAAFLTPGVPEIQKQAIQQIVTRAFLNPHEEIILSDREIEEEDAKVPDNLPAKSFLPSFNGAQPTIVEIQDAMKSDAVRQAFDGRSDRAKNSIARIFSNQSRFDNFKNQSEAQQLRAVSRAPRTREQILSAMKSDAVRAAFNGRSQRSQDLIIEILSRDADFVAFAAKTEAQQIRAVSPSERNRVKAR